MTHVGCYKIKCNKSRDLDSLSRDLGIFSGSHDPDQITKDHISSDKIKFQNCIFLTLTAYWPPLIGRPIKTIRHDDI